MADANGKLVLVPTPIGNLGDMTLRSLEVLREADCIYAEDTRVTGKLLSALEVPADGRLRRLDENTLAKRADDVAAQVRAGQVIAYCSDAGMPGVSDPGLRLVAVVREAGGCVEVLPGASAATTAYVASGTAFNSFYFGGFFPRKAKEQEELLEKLAGLDAALIFYESPKRVSAAVRTIAKVYQFRDIAICRELTKLHEEIIRGNAVDVARELEMRSGGGAASEGVANGVAAQPLKGEIVIVIDGPSAAEETQNAALALEAAESLAQRLAAEGASQKTIVSELMSAFQIPRNEAYGLALKAKRH